ncbi:fimbria/pilus outer membrane usher protein [Pseudomonas sp. efr-133-TYG-23]|uniref:fimbria/pilus outer membrane usher protein n=1 Tax=Pseudomonas sp. efr-133-TYG-23 TaxID=3040309 RepID=UPI00255793F1|nr:fimbria/pilus outer membrane usher protein [Pseudomonas sp. efr-133-TYG-23]
MSAITPTGVRSAPLARRGLSLTMRSLLLVSSAEAMDAHGAEYVEFNPAFFADGAAGLQVDIAKFSQGNVVLPGTYRSEVYLNGQWLGRESVTFIAVQGQPSAQLCLEREALQRFGIEVDSADQHTPGPRKPFDRCADIASYLPGASSQFDIGETRLDLQIPQVYLTRQARGYVDPRHWESGVDAAFVRYNANTFTTRTNGRSLDSHYVGLNTGLNLGDWHWRHNGSYSHSLGAAGYQSNATYVQRELSRWRSQLMAGEIHTPGELFDSIRLRGISLFSDDRMLPDSMTGFAPVVRGVAETNARVSVRQRGVLLSEVSVAPGPFVLDDFFPTGYGGDLSVTITEADGRQRAFIVPFAANAHLLRPGYRRYTLSVGQVDELGLRHPPKLMQATYQQGLSNLLTGYTGAMLGEDYRAQLAGAAFNTPLGALSVDLTHSSADIPRHGSRSGHSVQLRYSKNFADSGTHFTLGAYRYSTSGFLTAGDAAQLRDHALDGRDLDNVSRLRDRMDISLNQSLSHGSVYVTGSSQHYWNRSGGNLTFSAGYSGHWKNLHYTLSVQRGRDVLSGEVDQQLDLTLSLPLGSGTHTPTLTSTAYRGDHNSGERISLGGSWGEHNQLSYGLSTSRTQGSGNTQSADMKYQADYGVLSASYGHSEAYRSTSLGMTGGLVAHADGLIFAPELGDTLGIVQAPDAQGARINGNHAAHVGKHGQAVVSHLTPYRQNVVELDPKDLSVDVELKTAARNVAPRAGSVVKLQFETVSGQALLISTQREDGSPLPFGSDVFDEDGASVGIVGQGGKAFVRVSRARGKLTVKWGSTATATCWFTYNATIAATAQNKQRLRHLNADLCQLGADLAAQPPPAAERDASG